MTPLGERASFEVYPFVDGSRRILGSNYGFAEPADRLPPLRRVVLEGRLPVGRLIDRRIGLDDLEDAFEAMRGGGTPARSSRSDGPGLRLCRGRFLLLRRRDDRRLGLLDRRQQRAGR